MKTINIVITLIITSIILTIITSCGMSVDVSYDYDNSINFNKYKTYKLADWNERNSELVSDVAKISIYNAMRWEMEQRGYVLVDSIPDLVVDVFVVTDIQRYTTAYTTHMGMGGYNGWYGYYGWYHPGFGYGGVSTTEFVDSKRLLGTLVFDVYDENAKQLIWQGVGRAQLDNTSRLTEQDFNNVVGQIFYKYPVKIE